MSSFPRYFWISKFQSTPPRRRRPMRGCPAMRGCLVPIHASAKEATGIFFTKPLDILFQSTPPRRRRRQAHSRAIFMPIRFQSTPPRRRRQSTGETTGETTGFNPRLREGGDNRMDGLMHWKRGFNPRLREGGDCLETSWSGTQKGFNPRLREGGDQFTGAFYKDGRVSIHASAKEATVSIVVYVRIIWFQSTPPRRRRHGAERIK